MLVKARDIRLVIMTIRRSPEYIHKTLASLLLSDPLVHQLKGIHLVVGSADIEYLNQYQHHERIHIHPMPIEEAESSRDWIVHRKFCQNYYRCLTVPLPDYHGLCICEDDIAFQDRFVEEMLSAINELEQAHHIHHYLLDMYLPNELSPDPSFDTGKKVAKYFAHAFYGTQCIYYSKSVIPGIAQLIYEQGVAEYRSPGDLLIGQYAQSTNNLYATVQSLVQHIGFHSTGLAGMFHRSYSFHNTAPAANEKDDYNEIRFDLRESIGGVVKKLAFAAQAKGLELIVDVAVDVPQKVVGKLEVLNLLLYFLIKNAILFTEQGEIAIGVRLESIAGKDICLHFIISDTGNNGQKNVFESLINDSPLQDKDEKVAKDLAFCSGLAETLEGELWIEVEEEAAKKEGCTLQCTAHFELPESLHLPSVGRPLEEFRGLPVLVVDDNCTARSMLVEVLNDWGMNAIPADGGQSALELLNKNKLAGNQFWMVLLDAAMPGTDGFKVARYIQDHPELTRFTLMMLSYEIPGDKAALCREVGIHDHLNKPILHAELLEAFRYFINGS